MSSFMGSTVQLLFSSYVCKTVQIKPDNRAVSLTSVDSSNGSEKHLLSLQSCWFKSSMMASEHCVAVFPDIWRALIEENIPGLFLKSRNNGSAAPTNAFLFISPSWKNFLCLTNKWLTKWCFGSCLHRWWEINTLNVTSLKIVLLPFCIEAVSFKFLTRSSFPCHFSTFINWRLTRWLSSFTSALYVNQVTNAILGMDDSQTFTFCHFSPCDRRVDLHNGHPNPRLKLRF